MKVDNKNTQLKAESAQQNQTDFELSALNFQLKIGYDGKRATNNFTGLGNYSRALINHFAKQFTHFQFFIYTTKVADSVKSLPLFQLSNVKLKTPTKGDTKFLWRSFGIIKQLLRDKIQLYHGLSHELPFGIHHTKIKSVVTIHDLIFLKLPQNYKLIDRIIYKWKSKYACVHSNKIIAISEQTKKDIVELYQISPEKIEVIYQSCDDSFKHKIAAHDLAIVRSKYNLPEEFLLNVGTIENRKNLLLIIKALPQIKKQIPLVVIGKETKYFKAVKKEIINLQLQNRVIFLKNIPFEDLPSIYQMAKIFVYPSIYEGFGIPIIEALYSNIPVIAATGSCLEEAGGPASIYVSPFDPVQLATEINHLIANEDLITEIVKHGAQYVRKFNNDEINQQLLSLYQKTLNN